MELVLVHGAYHGAWCWSLVVPELERLGHDVVTVDLPIDEPGAGAAAYADAIVAAASGLVAPVLIGHSMAGVALPLVAAERPVHLMVFLAAFIPEPGRSLADQRESEPIDPDYDLATAEFEDLGDGVFAVGPSTATEMFYHDVPEATRSWAIQQLRPQAYVFMSETTPLSEWPEVPSAYVVCRDDHAINPEWGRTAATTRLGVEALEIEGGHSPFLTRPAELAGLLNHLIA